MDTFNEKVYLDSLEMVRDYGSYSQDRTGVGTLRLPGVSMKFNLQRGYPLLTTKKVLFYPMLIELLWFLQGRNDLEWLQNRKCNIWNQWHDEKNTIGPGYGVQWRRHPDGAIHYIDQLKNLIEGLKKNPNSRRHMINAWNVAQIDEMVLPPCHFASQYIVIDNTLHTILYQRSGDLFLGVPFNIASYALLTELLAKECDLEVGTLTHHIGDAHIYSNHLDAVNEQLTREIKKAPELFIDSSIYNKGLLDWIDTKCKDLKLEEIKELFKVRNYNPAPFIKAEVAV